MKKFGAIFFLIIYTSTALGETINFHYCSGHLTHISVLNIGGKTSCSCNPDAMPKGCCKDNLYSKADKHYSNPASYTISSITFLPGIPPAHNLFDLVLYNSFLNTHNFDKYVRRSCQNPIYLRNRVFRI